MRLKFVTILALIFSGTIFSFTACAAEKKLAIEEIVVTARKQEESAQSIPVAITAISEELDNSTIRNLADINGFAPNVIVGEDGGRAGGGASINIRGLSPSRTDDNSADATVAVVIDGVFLGSFAGQLVENFDLERIEVLRGPQGTLFGKNTVGGVINVIRSRPTGELGGKFKITAGQDGQQELRAVVNTSLIDETLAAKFFYTNLQFDGYRRNTTTGGKQPEGDYQNYGVTFLWTPTDRFEALFTAEKIRDQGDLSNQDTPYSTPPGVIPPPTDPREVDYSGGFLQCVIFPLDTCRTSLDIPSTSSNDSKHSGDFDLDAYALNMKYELNENLTLVSVTGYRDMNEDRFTDLDGSAAPFITIDRVNEFDQFSQELRLDGAWDTLTLTAGLYYYNAEFEQDWSTGGTFWATLFGAVAYDPGLYGLCLAGAFSPIACDDGITNVTAGENVYQILFETQETTSVAAFAQVDWQFAEQWTLTAGLRWTREEKDFIAGQSYLTSGDRQWLRNFPEYADLDNEWTETSPKVGLSYKINDSSLAYISYSEGFSSGGFFGVNQNTRDFIRDQYDPEYANSWEIGYKSQHLDNRLRLNVTAFLNNFEDKQESFVALDADTKTVATKFDNAGEVEYKGWELEAEYVFSEYFRAFFNYGYLDAKYIEFETDINGVDNITLIEDATHLTPRNAPEFTLGVGGTVTIPVGNGVVEFYSKYALIDEIETSLLNVPLGYLEKRKDLVASVGYYTEKWSVSAYGKNLTDEEHEIFGPIATLFATGSIIEHPRTYAVEFAYEF